MVSLITRRVIEIILRTGTKDGVGEDKMEERTPEAAFVFIRYIFNINVSCANLEVKSPYIK